MAVPRKAATNMEGKVRKIIATEFYSLDGMMSDPNDTMEWITGNFSEGVGAAVDEVYQRCDTLFLGANTYKIMASYWPTAATNPDAFEGDAAFAAVMNGMRKVVFSKEALKPDWDNTEFKPEIDAEEIRQMKKAPGKDMLIAGSAHVVQQFANLGLTDEYHLLLFPVILGVGKPLFKGVQDQHALTLVETKAFENGVVLLRYLAAV
jgi:dihydrofolate reductase